MSNNKAKFVNHIDVAPGRELVRNGLGKWELVVTGKISKGYHLISENQAQIIDAAIIAGIAYARGVPK